MYSALVEGEGKREGRMERGMKGRREIENMREGGIKRKKGGGRMEGREKGRAREREIHAVVYTVHTV